MAEQLTDAALRVLVAQWIRAALGELVEDSVLEYESEENSIASLQPSCTKGEGEMWTGLHLCERLMYTFDVGSVLY
ncbi:MAG: hypothetical protein ACJ8AG_17695 [Ktedonobacteraceae bacterium]